MEQKAPTLPLKAPRLEQKAAMLLFRTPLMQ
jgi:hypothetical protein